MTMRIGAATQYVDLRDFVVIRLVLSRKTTIDNLPP
jgi:hypothetical protein